MNNDIENQMMNKQIKKLSCLACSIFIGTLVFSGIIAYVLCLSFN